jgi:hypothetical protein
MMPSTAFEAFVVGSVESERGDRVILIPAMSEFS